jgi:DNA-binding SARP family transcriptional activator
MQLSGNIRPPDAVDLRIGRLGREAMRRDVGTRWRIYLLRELRVEGCGRVLTRFRTQKAAALLAYLAYYLGRPHHRDALVELLWPACAPQAGRNNLSRELCGLRDQLEPPGVPPGTVLQADRFWVRLQADAVSTDVAAFEALLRESEGAGSPVGRTRALTEAIELYDGELLSGSTQEWVLLEREWLADRYFQALGRMIAYLEEAGQLVQALEQARRGVRADPLREEAQRDLIRLLAASGRPGAAVRQYQKLEWLLKQELGEEPMAETCALANRLGVGGGGRGAALS